MADKILIIDDELNSKKELYKRIYQDSLEENWYQLIFAMSGESALEIIRKDKKQEIALIILDLRLDGAKLDGIQFANKLAQSHIDKKIIVWTAYPEWENSFTDEAKSLIVKVLKKNDHPHHYLKDISDAFMIAQQLEPPGKQGIRANSRLIGYKAIRHWVKSLPSKQLYKLILEVVRCLPSDLLKQLKEELPQEIDSIYQSAIEQNKLIQLIAKVQKNGWLREIPKAQDLNNPWLEIIERKHIDHWLHWIEEGNDTKCYISKTIIRPFFPIELQEPSKYLDNPNQFNFDEYRVRYYRPVKPNSQLNKSPGKPQQSGS